MSVNEEVRDTMFAKAKKALDFSYSPYSGFKVAAALLTKTGSIYTGCNIENAAYSATLCAERTAFVKAISEGERTFQAMLIVSRDKDGKMDFCPPCGTCRQVMAEFGEPHEFLVILTDGREFKTYKLAELLPQQFSHNKL